MTDLWNKELESNSSTSQLFFRHSKFPAGDNTFKCYHNNIDKYLSRFFFFVVKHILSLRQFLFFYFSFGPLLADKFHLVL